MDYSPEKYIGRLTELSSKKYKLLQEILALTRAQSQTITEEGVESLGRLIGDKQVKIDEINKLDEDFNVYFQRLKRELKVSSLEEMNVPGVAGTKELQESIRQIMSLIGEICTIEKENNDRAKELLNSLGTEIKKINQGKKVSSTYIPRPLNIPSYFIDKKK